NKLYLNSILSFALLAVVSTAIWFYGADLTFQQHAPLVKPGMRMYAILVLFLAWLLKFLLIDLDLSHPHLKNIQIRQELEALANRFRGAFDFMHKTTINQNGKTIRLQQLPCF